MKNEKLKPFKIKNEKEIFEVKNKLSIIETDLITPLGENATWHYVNAPDVVLVVALDTNNNIYLQKEWRLARKDFLWEITSGKVEVDSPTEKDFFNIAQKELQEEIGFKAGKIEKIISFYLDNHSNKIYHLFVATDLKESKLEGDEYEYLEVKKFSLKEAWEITTEKQIPNAQTLIALLLLKERYEF